MNEDRIKSSPNFINGKAQNYEETPMLVGDQGSASIMWDLIVNGSRPVEAIPAVKTDLHALDISEEMFIWLGHSSVLLQTHKKRLLVDPVLSEAASPVPFINKPFEGTDIYTASDIPNIDYLIITHDHYDHLSKATLKAIQKSVKLVICPLGVGKYLMAWGYPKANIIEMDWDEEYTPEAGITIYCLAARHYSGRSLLDKNSTLWASFLLQTPERKIYFSGDSGYGEHFKAIGSRFESVDLAFIESGQYDKRWKYIHMHPSETLAAGVDINTKYLMPVHNSKYKLAYHDWSDPLSVLSLLHKNKAIILMTPMIGEKIPLWNEEYVYQKWWE